MNFFFCVSVCLGLVDACYCCFGHSELLVSGCFGLRRIGSFDSFQDLVSDSFLGSSIDW